MANLYFEAQLDAEQLKRELRELNNRLNGFAQNAKTQGDEIDQVFKRIGQAAAGYFTLTGGKEFIGQLINVRGEFQQLDIALETMLRNKSASNKLTAEVVQLAAKTPYSLTELGKGAKQLIAFKEPADKVADTLRRIGDISAGVSAPVGDLVSAYGKVSAKGKMQAEELNQFAERGVPIISELAKVIGTTDDKIYKMAEDGKIGFKELQQAIMNMTNEGGQFANMMEKQAGSLTGLVSNLGDAWDRMLNDIGQSNQGLLADGIKGLTSLVDNYEEVLKVLGLIVGTYGAYKAAIVAVSMAQKVEQVLSMVSAWTGLTKSINSAKNAQMAFNVASRLNPMGLAASAIAALVGGLMLYSSASKKAASASEDVGRAVMAETTKMDALFSIAKNTTISTEARKSAIDEINKVYAPYLENMLTEKSTLEEIEKAQRNATNALIADVGVKRSKDKLAAALDQFSEDQDKLLSGFLSDLVDVSGAGVQSAFMSELNKLVDYANQYGLMGANGYSLAYRRFYDTFAKQVAQSTGFMEYSEHDIAVMVQNIADKRKVLDDETKKIQGLIDAYSALTSGKKNKNSRWR